MVSGLVIELERSDVCCVRIVGLTYVSHNWNHKPVSFFLEGVVR